MRDFQKIDSSSLLDNMKIEKCVKHGAWKKLIESQKCPSCNEEMRLKEHESPLDLEKRKLDVGNMINKIGIQKRYENVTLENYRCEHVSQTHALEMSKSFIDNFEKNDGQSLLFSGQTGRGKTHLAIAIAKELAHRYLIQSIYIKHYNVIDEFKARKKSLLEAKLLIIDEVGLANIDFQRDVAYKIIDERYDAMLPTILITNLSSEEFKQNVQAAVKSRLAEVSSIVLVEGKDYRYKKKEKIIKFEEVNHVS